MPNGFHGSADDWEKLESSLQKIDPCLVEFARVHGMNLGKNYHNWPERSLMWSNRGLKKLIKIFLEDNKNMTYSVWLCVSEDRHLSRYWKTKFLLKGVPWTEIHTQLDNLLQKAHEIVETWSAQDLEFAARIGPSG